ncbi:MAG: hypothetical protein KGQ93_04900 [Cyanobacteria bacterium REEB459]|nr:hypothetical protein [Cyanobacteria bacterium REEB459]
MKLFRQNRPPIQPPQVSDYLNRMAPEVRASLTPQQFREVSRVIDLAMPRPSPKIVDLRFDIDVIFGRFFIVLFVGKDRRRSPRQHSLSRFNTLLNWLTAVVLLLGVNLMISVTLFLGAYLIKSAVGINLMPGHLGDLIHQVF